MSSAGQVIGGVVGAVVGFVGSGFNPMGAVYGAQLGMMAGGMLDPPKGPTVEGPRLDDLTVQTATYGAVIPRTYGTIALYGNVFWLENNTLKEVVKKTKSGGKGGGSQTTTKTYSYYATFAVGLCHCTSAPIIGVRRIWIKNKLWYDAGSSDQSAIRVSNANSSLFTVHDGSDTQQPDDRMQATLGAANVPAYRGLCYIVFKDLPLADYGNSLLGAQVKVEVVGAGAMAYYANTGRLMPSLSIWYRNCWNGRLFVSTMVTGGSYATSPDGITWTARTFPAVCEVRAISASPKFTVMVGSTATGLISRDGVTWATVTMPYGGYWMGLGYDGSDFCAVNSSGKSAFSPTGEGWIGSVIPGGYSWSAVAGDGRGNWVAVSDGAAWCAVSPDGSNWTLHAMVSQQWHSIVWNGSIFCAIAVAATVNCVATSPDGITWTYGNAPNTGFDRMVWTGSEFYVQAGGNIAYTSPDGLTWTPRSVIASGGNSWYDIAWNGAVICGVGQDSLNYYNTYTSVPFGISQTNPTLASILQSELLLSNLLSVGDIDTSLLTQSVRGYRIAAVAALRSGVEPLQGAWPFDVIQHGYKIQMKPRGSTSVATIPASDLDARGAGESPGISITNVREMDSVIARRVSLSYIDVEREYDTGEQYAERMNTDAVNIQTIEMAIAMTSGEAASTAEVLLYLYWLERYSLAFSLPSAYNYLESADVITVAADEATYALRLTGITYTQDGRLECSAKYNSAATYTATALGEVGASLPGDLSEPGDTAYELLDIPLLIDAQDEPGFSAAVTGYLSGWPGAVLFRSEDTGQTWTDLQAFAAPGSIMGYASAIGAGRTDILDKSSLIVVSMQHGTLSSVSEASMLNGTNLFAYGARGRWEIIGAQNCTLQGDGTYWLTDLLRGRFGSEWACGLHAFGDILVPLDTANLSFLPMTLNRIGLPHTYRMVTASSDFDSAPDDNFTYTGVNLECLAPVYLNGSQNPSSGDWSISWLRRTRIGGEWRDYVDATLGEASESYQIEIYSDSGYTTIKRTIMASTPFCSYTAVQQITDFGTAQSTLYIKVYQVSASVGIGYPLTGSLVGVGSAAQTVEYLVVAGGGGGGSASSGAYAGAGGGAGGFRSGVGYNVFSAISYSIAVGAGGAPSASGNNSLFDSIVSVGGGSGQGDSNPGSSGGSGGGKIYNVNPGFPGTAGQGNSGGGGGADPVGSPAYPSGGGGGAGAVGGSGVRATETAGSGGAGLSSSISGASVTYAGGGGGACYTAGTGGAGGAGGGGAGRAGGGGSGASGTANTGGGGGAGGGTASSGGSGGSGIVIIRYSDTYPAAASTSGSPSVVVSGGYRIYTWTTPGSGSITFA